MRHPRISKIGALLLAAGVVASSARRSFAADAGLDLANRPVAEVRVQGLKLVTEKLVRNQIRIAAGEPYDSRVVEEDIVRLTHLGRFSSVQAKVDPRGDGSVVLTYVLVEQALLADVQVVGNKEINDQDLLSKAMLKAGDPVDQFLIDRGLQEIRRSYQEKGFFVTDVTYDKELLAESSLLLYRVREGPRPRIQAIKFEGNKAFTSDQLESKIKSDEAFKLIFIYLKKGELNREVLDADAARVREFYKERGYLEADVGRRIDVSPDQQEATIVFVVEEGRRYTVDKIRVEGNSIFSEQQILETLELKSGDVFSGDKLRKSQEAITDLYGKLGFIDIKIDLDRLFHEKDAKVDVVVQVKHSVGRDQYAPGEGVPYTVGRVMVKGNELTKDKVILRSTRGLDPGQRFDKEGIAKTEKRLGDSSLFSEARVTVQGDPKDEIRDVLVEVKERNTGSVSFGAGISSDSGVIGAIELTQRNFDIADTPESFGEFFTGKAFRGAGQYFSIALQPGNETSRYSVSFREPYLLDSNYFFDSTAYFFQRDRDRYKEERIGGNVGLGQRFGDVWSASVRMKGDQVRISDIDAEAPYDVFDVEGNSIDTAAGIVLSRNTTDDRIFPTRGSNFEIAFYRGGALGGDYEYNTVDTSFRKFWTVDEDFFGRRSVFSLRAEVGYIFDGKFTSAADGRTVDDAPIFDRLYAGGQRTFRGFSFRGVSPHRERKRGPDGKFGTEDDTFVTTGGDPVGGDWMFLIGPEYSIPIFQDIVRVVFFSDTGTVQEDVGFDEYRVSIGAGLRIKIPFLGQAPFALDAAYPLVKQKGDDTRFLSFDLAVPF